jgi:hypothetical protein
VPAGISGLALSASAGFIFSYFGSRYVLHRIPWRNFVYFTQCHEIVTMCYGIKNITMLLMALGQAFGWNEDVNEDEIRGIERQWRQIRHRRLLSAMLWLLQ